jgi:hypothetical protein
MAGYDAEIDRVLRSFFTSDGDPPSRHDLGQQLAEASLGMAATTSDLHERRHYELIAISGLALMRFAALEQSLDAVHARLDVLEGARG